MTGRPLELGQMLATWSPEPSATGHHTRMALNGRLMAGLIVMIGAATAIEARG